jgi:hypothetical protein
MTEAERERLVRQDEALELEKARKDAFITQTWRQTWVRRIPASKSPELRRWFQHRGIDYNKLDIGRLDDALGWLPDCPRGRGTSPTMVALMTDAISNEACGIHRTFLLPDGSGKAPVDPVRMMLGRAGVVRLSRDDDVETCIGLCEGIETGLAIMAAGWAPVWACGSLGALTAFPVLSGIECVTVFADGKAHEIEGARTCARRWADAGREARVWVPHDGRDFNDILRVLG